VDDSIVRGNTQRALVRMLREAGALEVHVRISSPPVTWPCFYGIDFATRAELIANGLDTEGIRRSVGADSLGFVSLAGLIAATEQPKTRLCRACFDGEYPIGLPAGELIGKHVLEGVGKRVTVSDADTVNGVEQDNTSGAISSGPGTKSLVGSPGGGDALQRP
jgi:amidophosphoribosyltransferase